MHRVHDTTSQFKTWIGDLRGTPDYFAGTFDGEQIAVRLNPYPGPRRPDFIVYDRNGDQIGCMWQNLSRAGHVYLRGPIRRLRCIAFRPRVQVRGGVAWQLFELHSDPGETPAPSTSTTPDFLAQLELVPPVKAGDVKAAYRRMALKCHPDGGGSHEAFITLRSAYERALEYVGGA